jgi:hypothetical protein
VGIGTANPRNGLELAKFDSNYITSLRVGGITGGTITVPLQSETSRHQILFSSWRDVVTNTVGAKIVAINKNVYQENNALVQNTDLAFFTLGVTPANSDDTIEKMRITSSGNVGIGTTSPSYKLDVNGAGRFTDSVTAPNFIGSLSGNASTATKTLATVTGTGTIELVRGAMADNDYFRILIGGTASNAGYVEIATADDGTEPIYVRQYTGVFANLVRTATLLDSSGNTTFPGSVTATSFLGNASTATALTTNAGSNTNPIYFSGGKPTASSYSFGNASGNIPISNGTLNSNLNADLLDGKHSTSFHQRIHYGTTARNTGYYKINILPTTSWMLSFTIRVYQTYSYYDIRISGYNYGTSHWYSPKADLLNSDNVNITVQFGYDSDYNL